MACHANVAPDVLGFVAQLIVNVVAPTLEIQMTPGATVGLFVNET
jgi:hypothetical protein